MWQQIKNNASAILVLAALVSVCFGAYNKFALAADLNDFRAEYAFDKEAREKKAILDKIFECKKLYGPTYEYAPDEFTRKICQNAEIEYKTRWGTP